LVRRCRARFQVKNKPLRCVEKASANISAISITNSWLTYAAIIGLVLLYGGGQTALFALIPSAAAQWLVLLGLAEFSSALPSSGVRSTNAYILFSSTDRRQGQYHYTYIVAPERTRDFAAYIVGFLNIIAWWANAASGTIYVAISAYGIASFWHEDLVVEQWQVYLLYLLVIALTRKKISSRRKIPKCMAHNLLVIPIFTVPQKHLDYMTKASLYLSVFGMIMIIIIALAMGRDHYEPRHLIEYEGTSGWSPGPAWMLSIATGQYCFFGTGACTHIAEEMPQPSRKLPRVM